MDFDSPVGPIKELKLKLDLPENKTGLISRTPVVEDITDKHRWVVGALASGFSANDVAKMFDLSVGYVHQINLWDHPDLNAVRAQTKMKVAGAVEDLTTRIALHAEAALTRTVEIMQGPDVANARLAAKDILDRAGYAPVKKIAVATKAVPQDEFIDAVKRMTEADQAAARRDEWAFKAPVRVVDGSANSAQVGG